MGTFQSFRKAYGALKDSTMVGLAKVNSEYKDLDIAIVKATNHVEHPPKERHVRKIFSATSVIRPRADVAYCIHTLSKRLTKTRSWIVALKTLIVIHRTLREGDPTFREELLNYSRRGHVLQITNFKDDSSPLAWDCSAWVRTYALFLEERLECFRVLRYDIESERPPPNSQDTTKVTSRTRGLNGEQLLQQLPSLQQLLYRLIGCQPEGAAYTNHLIQYALALVLKESFKIYCAINDGIINLVDVFFDMSKHEAVKALQIYKRAGQQAINLADLYDYCRGLELSRNFQFPTLRQPPASFLQTMEEYIKEAPQFGSVSDRLEYHTAPKPSDKRETQESKKPGEDKKEELVNTVGKVRFKEVVEDAPLITPEEDTREVTVVTPDPNSKAQELEEINALALAIVPNENYASKTQSSSCGDLLGLDTTGWELTLVTTPSSTSTNRDLEPKLGGGFDTLLLDSLYQDNGARRNLQLQNAGYGYLYGQGYGTGGMSVPNPFEHQHDPFMKSHSFAAPTNVQMARPQQQQQQQQQQQHQYYPHQLQLQLQQQQQQQQNMMLAPCQYQSPHQQQMQTMEFNPFGDPFGFSAPAAATAAQQQYGNHHFSFQPNMKSAAQKHGNYGGLI